MTVKLILLSVLLVTSLFKEVAEQVGLKFQHYNGMTGKFYLPEITGSGVALFDFDNDGDLDVFLVQGNVLEPNTRPSGTLFGKLFRNDLVPGKTLSFTEITQKSGIVATGYGMGVAAGEIAPGDQVIADNDAILVVAAVDGFEPEIEGGVGGPALEQRVEAQRAVPPVGGGRAHAGSPRRPKPGG